MNVIVGQLAHKRVVRKLSGDIIDWQDDTRGGAIIQKGQIMNPRVIEEEQKKAADRAVAARAQAESINNVTAPVVERNTAPSRVDELEQRVSGMEDTLKQILEAVKK